MSAVEALRDGDVDRALIDLQDEVRASPDDPRHRIFLFQLLSVLGQWDRALTQLQVVRDLDPGAIAMVRTYESVLQCEVFREGVFAGEKTPLILGDPEPWIAKLVEALRLSAQGDAEAAPLARTRLRRSPDQRRDAHLRRSQQSTGEQETEFAMACRRRFAAWASARSNRQRTLLLGAARTHQAFDHRPAGGFARSGLVARPISCGRTKAKRSE